MGAAHRRRVRGGGAARQLRRAVGKWDFAAHTGEQQLRLRDHGNELVVGLTLLYALEYDWQTPRARYVAAVIARMLDRVLASANADGLLYNQVDAKTLAPIDERPVGQLGLRLRRGLHVLPGAPAR